MAIGIILTTLAGSFNVDLLGYLFGNILAIEVIEVWISVILAGVIIIAVALFYQELFYLTFDPESARASGIHAKRLDRLLAVLTAVTIVLGMKIVGVLLVSALIVIPSAAGLQLATNFRRAIVTSSIVATQ
jgi:zinc transport system permease protein